MLEAELDWDERRKLPKDLRSSKALSRIVRALGRVVERLIHGEDLLLIDFAGRDIAENLECAVPRLICIMQ